MNADGLRKIATRLVDEVQAKRRPSLDNTPKRAKQAHAKRIEADHLDRVREACVLLADTIERGDRTPAGDWTKKLLLEALRTRIDHSGGYYSLHDTGEFADQSEAAQRLREFVDNHRGRDAANRLEAQRTADSIEKMEREVRFGSIPGFYPTPANLIDLMLEKAYIEPGMTVLEPSAGKGDIADAIRKKYPDVMVHCVEINHTLQAILRAKLHVVVGSDFLNLGDDKTPDGLYDRVVMNPPFEGLADIRHVKAAYGCLKPGGRLVSLTSPSWMTSNLDLARGFRQWITELQHQVLNIQEGAFKTSFNPTGVNVRMLVLDKDKPKG